MPTRVAARSELLDSDDSVLICATLTFTLKARSIPPNTVGVSSLAAILERSWV